MFRILPRCRLIYISQNHVVSSRLKIGIWSDVLSLCVDDALMSSIRSSISSRTKQCWIVWRGMCVRPPRDVEAIADCSRRSFNRSVLPTKAATYESRFTIHRPTRMDSMTNMAAIQMIQTIQDQSTEVVTRSSRLFEAAMRAPTMPRTGISARN